MRNGKTNSILLIMLLILLPIALLTVPVSFGAAPNWSAVNFRGNGIHSEVHNSSAGTQWELYGMVC